MDWAKVKESRDQLVLFPERLDESIPANHDVRVLDRILRGVDWSSWETKYALVRGRPPLHPRIVASVILYGLFCRIISSRMLEEALTIRLDFRWLVESRSIDHTTICKFRIGNQEALSGLFIQMALLGQELGWVRLDSLGFDATRMRSNNSRQASRTPERLRELYAPTKTTDPTKNPAVRENLKEPVAPSDRGRLPVVNVTVAGVKRTQLSKDAFVFDSENDCYWCPNGQALEFKGKSRDKRSSGESRMRFRYKIDSEVCSGCPLAALCLRKAGTGRQVTHEEHELSRVAHAQKMATEEAKEIYRKRQHPTERPFAVIKSQFGMRQFLTRTLERVSQEWNWCVAAFNVHRLIGLSRNHAGPPPPACEVSPSLSPF